MSFAVRVMLGEAEYLPVRLYIDITLHFLNAFKATPGQSVAEVLAPLLHSLKFARQFLPYQ